MVILRCALTGILLLALAQLASAADPPTLDNLEATAAQLASPLSVEREAGEGWLKANANAAFPELARLIEQGGAKQQMRAANVAAVFISPWVRADTQGKVHKGQINLFQPRRPTARPVDHPHATVIRNAALSALAQVLESSRKAAEDDDGRKLPSFPGWEHTELVRALCDCIAEVADGMAIERLVGLLSEEPNRFQAGHMMWVLDTYYGLPRSYTWGGICGNSTPEEFRAFDRAETARCKKAKATLLAWHEQHASKPLRERIDAALDVWDNMISGQEHYAYYTESGEWATQTHYASMIRLGEPAVDALRKRAANAAKDKYWHRGAYEIVIAAITGRVDNPFVKKMFEGETFEQMLACEIIAAAGSREFKDRLAAMVQSNGPYKKASYTLAVVYRCEAIPILEKAWSSDFVASCAIAELRAWGE